MAGKFDKFSNILAASTPSKAAASSKTMILQNIVEGERPEYQYIKIDNIELNPNNDYNSSDTEEEIRELSEDIRRNGLLHNIVVSYTESGTYRLLSGERRLRAYRLLFEETKEAKFSSIYALIRKGLSDVEEMIILDAANLHVRNGSGDEKKYRKATIRFVDNLKAKFNISDEEAITLTKQYSSATNAVIDKNITLERDLHPSLLSLLDSNVLSKTQALEYAKLPKEVQSIIAENLEGVENKKSAVFKEKNDSMVESAKEIKSLNATLASQKKEFDAIAEEVAETKKEIAQRGEDDKYAEALKEKEEQLQKQKKQYASAIKKTEKAIDEQVNDIKSQVSEKKEELKPEAVKPTHVDIEIDDDYEDEPDDNIDSDVRSNSAPALNAKPSESEQLPSVASGSTAASIPSSSTSASVSTPSPATNAVRTEFVNTINNVIKSVREFKAIDIAEKNKYITDEDRLDFRKKLKAISGEVNRLAELLK